jgi:hypothetical protein
MRSRAGLLFAAGMFVLSAPGGSLDMGVRVGLCFPFGLDLLLAYPFRFPFYTAMTGVRAIVPLRVGESAACFSSREGVAFHNEGELRAWFARDTFLPHLHRC